MVEISESKEKENSEPDHGPTIRSFFKQSYEARKSRDGVTYAELAKETGIAPSTLTTILGETDTRPKVPTTRVVVRLARALCPQDRELIEFTEEALAKAGRPQIDRDSELLNENVLERVVRSGKVRYALIRSEPFAYLDSRKRPAGFAWDVFQLLCNLMDLQAVPVSGESLTFAELPNALSSGKVDVVVSGVVPTFRRRQQMEFSRPFPYVSLPVSAVRHQASDVRTVKDLLTSTAWTDQLLLVEDEVGHDFARTLVRQAVSWDDEERTARIKLAKSLDSRKLADQLLATDGPRVLLADLETCSRVLGKGGDVLTALDGPDSDEVDRALRVRSAAGLGLRDLGEYGIAFALPRYEVEWLNHFNLAFDSLLSEGLRALLGIYAKWWSLGLRKTFRVQRGYGIGSERVFRAFDNLKDELPKEK